MPRNNLDTRSEPKYDPSEPKFVGGMDY